MTLTPRELALEFLEHDINTAEGFDFIMPNSFILAQAYLDLEVRHKAAMGVVEAARSAYGFLDGSIHSSLEKQAKEQLNYTLTNFDKGSEG